MRLWYPDFCPSGRCIVELERDATWGRVKRVITACPHHQNVKAANSIDDVGLFRALEQTSRAKEAARAAVKRELALDKEHPGVPFRVEANGDIVVMSGAAGVARTRMRNAADAAIAALDRPIGTSRVTVE